MNSESPYWFVRRSKSIIFLIITLALVGGYLALSIPVAVFPSTNFPRVVIGIDNGVMPIDQMMVTITRPLEEAVNNVQGLESVQSITSRGSAEIDLYFNWNEDMFQTLQRVSSAVASVQSTLPPTVHIEMHRLTFASFPIIGYSLTAESTPQTDLWEMATYEIKPRLNRLAGVSTVLVQGGDEPEFEISPSPAQLLATQATVPAILESIRRTNLIDSPGLLERNHQLYLGLVSAQVHTPDEIADIVIKSTKDGFPVRIRDVATVGPSVKPVYTIVTADTKPAVLLSINRQPESNTVKVAREVRDEVEQIKKSLPRGVILRPYYDQSTIVTQSLKSVRDAILIGLILASVIMVLFLRDWGTSLVAGLVIPITILITFIALSALGESFNLMTLGGLAAAVGLVIDDAIVVVENIVLHRDAGEGRTEAIHRALNELMIPLLGSTITPLVVFLPLISITGVTGTFFRALAVTMSVSLFTSLLLALVWTPNLALHFVRRNKSTVTAPNSGEESADKIGYSENGKANEVRRLMAAEEASMVGFFGKVVTFYERWLRRGLAHPWWLAAVSAALILASALCYRGLGTDLLPAMDEGGFVVDYVMPPGSSLQETDRVVSHLERICRAVPEVESTSRRTGMQLGLASVTEANTGDISVKLKEDRHRGIQDIINQIRAQAVSQEPELDVEFTQVLQDMISDLTGAPQPIQIKLFSPDGNLLNQWAPRVGNRMSKIRLRGKNPVVDVLNGVDNTTSGPALVFQVNPGTAARSGFTAEEVQLDASALLEGALAPTPVIVDGQARTLRVRLPSENRASLDAMKSTLLVSSTGQTATLGSLAAVTEVPGQTEILRENLQRDVSVTARLEGVDLGTGVVEVRRAVTALKLPASIRVEYGGTYREQQQSFHDLFVVLALAIVLVFLALLFEFGSFSAPLAILASAVLSTSGVFVALLVTGITFNISSFMGLIMVVGIVAKNGILLLDADQNFRRAGFSAEEAMVQAGRRRLRPILMTALAAVAGMLPLALAIGAGSQMLQPLAVAVIGGILVSMALSLVITPVVHFYLTRERA